MRNASSGHLSRILAGLRRGYCPCLLEGLGWILDFVGALVCFLELLKECEVALGDLLGLVLVLGITRRDAQRLRNRQPLLWAMLCYGVAGCAQEATSPGVQRHKALRNIPIGLLGTSLSFDSCVAILLSLCAMKASLKFETHCVETIDIIGDTVHHCRRYGVLAVQWDLL